MTSSRIIDLRSDTVTQPTPGMRKAMAEAVVGDDVHGDDPSVNALQDRMAAMLGKEAALFVPSGTMANQICIRTHTEPGDEIILEATAHPFLYETGALGGVCGVQAQLLKGQKGILEPEQVEKAIRTKETHHPPTTLIVLENTHNQGGGTIFPLSKIRDIRKVAARHGISMHMDGARLWNASNAAGVSLTEYAAPFETVSVCLSKGLGAPVGSVIVGEKKVIDRCRRFRKMFGGAMRQAGILAAAGLYALDHHLDKIREDHDNAKYLADGLSKIPGIVIRPEDTETNLVFFGMKNQSPQWLETELKKRDVWLLAAREKEVRAVTHLDVSRDQIDAALNITSDIAKNG